MLTIGELISLADQDGPDMLVAVMRSVFCQRLLAAMILCGPTLAGVPALRFVGDNGKGEIRTAGVRIKFSDMGALVMGRDDRQGCPN